MRIHRLIITVLISTVLASAAACSSPGSAEPQPSAYASNQETTGTDELSAEDVPSDDLSTDDLPSDDLSQYDLSYEVKLLLDSQKVLGDDHLLKEEWKQAFGITEDYLPIEVMYLDTPEKDFHRAGWINRLRLKSGKKKAERTYKKRYPLSGDDAEAVRAALSRAEADGFDFSDKAVSAELDWGYSTMTLSVSTESSGKYKDYRSLSSFSTEDAIAFLKSAMPEAELNWHEAQWGARMLDQAQMLGPFETQRIQGSWQGAEIQVDICPMRDGYVTELSLKLDGLAPASALREQMRALLEEKGLLLPVDSLKTQMILDEYLSPQTTDSAAPKAAAQQPDAGAST